MANLGARHRMDRAAEVFVFDFGKEFAFKVVLGRDQLILRFQGLEKTLAGLKGGSSKGRIGKVGVWKGEGGVVPDVLSPGAEGGDGESVVSFGEAVAVVVHDETVMEVSGFRQTE